MDDLMTGLLSAITDALAVGHAPTDAAVRVWERAKGSRAGLNQALVQLADEGKIHATVIPEFGNQRRVVRITGVDTARGEAARVFRPRSQPIDVGRVDALETLAPGVEKERIVFVAYGRDDRLRQSIFDFLRSINLYPLEWNIVTSLVGTGNPYIGQALDAGFECAQAVVAMFSPDEHVRLLPRLGGGEHGEQPRPNVLFEAGLAIGRDPHRTVIVEVGKLRPFSDFVGRYALRLDDTAPDAIARRQDFATALERAGCRVSTKGTDWHTTGSFRIDKLLE